MKDLRVYDMIINEFDETGVDINSFVHSPAHMRSFEVYGAVKQKYAVDTEKRMVTGVFILANFLIYRDDTQLGRHWVKFSPAVIEQIRNKFFITESNKNKNTEHEGLFVQGATLVESYIVHSTDKRYPKVPEMLSKQGVTDFSWIGSYYIQDERLWQDCKKGIFTGFSVEGYFDKKENQLKKANMSKTAQKIKNIFGDFFGTEAEKFTEVKTVDGLSLFFEGDLAKGTIMNVQDASGANIPAPAGDYQCDVNGKTYAITLDDTGAVTKLEEAAAMSETEQAIAEGMKKVMKDLTAKFAAQQKEIDAVKKANADFKKEIDLFKTTGKFSATGKATGDGDKEKKGFKVILEKGKK